MGKEVNCFGFQSRAYDLVHGEGSHKEFHEKHLKNCDKCSSRLKHFSLMTKMLRELEFPKLVEEVPVDSLRVRWNRLPWYIRSSFELTSIAGIILMVVVFFPKIQTAYEKRAENKLREFKAQDFSEENDGSDSKSTLGAQQARSDFDAEFLPDTTDVTRDSASNIDALLGHGSDQATGVLSQLPLRDSNDVVRPGEYEIWRFIIRTDSPREMRPKIVELLQKVLQDTVTKESIAGLLVPGGIQFNFLASKDYVSIIKDELQSLVSASSKSEDVVSSKNSFTWYKKKASKKDIPAGQSRIVIWLSQI